MTPKLMDRLARLEGAHAVPGGSGALPPELVQVWLRAIAVALGGYPHTRQPEPPYHEDSFGDGFARGLGYIDRGDMEARANATPDDWRQRIERASAALCERYEADGYPISQSRASHVMTAALNEWATAKAQNPDWPEADDSDTLTHALAFYGVPTEAAEART